LLLSLVIGSTASAVTMDWTPIGNPGNPCDPQLQGCFGAVDYSYNLGTYEVTTAQYAEFLNAKAAADPLELYSTGMGIMRFGGSGFYSYSVYPGREDMPVNYVSFYDALRFANWMNNGQGNSDTESGAYTLLGGTETPSNGDSVTRNSGAVIVLPREDEWYKPAVLRPVGGKLFRLSDALQHPDDVLGTYSDAEQCQLRFRRRGSDSRRQLPRVCELLRHLRPGGKCIRVERSVCGPGNRPVAQRSSRGVPRRAGVSRCEFPGRL
jgi:hypothetical protein